MANIDGDAEARDGNLEDLGEDKLVELLRGIAAPSGPLPLGQGDDCAITGEFPGKRLAWTLDTMVEGVHFRFWPGVAPEDIGYKLGAVNLSDLASKGALPRVALVSVAAPASASVERVSGVYRGLAEVLHGVMPGLVGGDTVRASEWVLSLALVGEIDSEAPVAGRDRAEPGDGLYVTGTLGGAAAGLAVLESGDMPQRVAHGELVRRFLRPEPRLAAGAALVARRSRMAMMDLSDGLARDANRLALASGVSLCLDATALPVGRGLEAYARETGTDAWRLALAGGEDYELLFACAETPPQAPGGVPVARVGRVEAGEGVWIEEPGGGRERVSPSGFEHF